MSYEIGNFSADTAVTADPTVPGRFLAHLSPNWNILYVFGGMTMATAVSAARAALSQPSFDLLTATATFLSPIQAGPQRLDVKTLRAGKGSEQLSVDMRGGTGRPEKGGTGRPEKGGTDRPEKGGTDRPGERDEGSDLHVVCTFGPKRKSDAQFVDLKFPDVPAPGELVRAKPPAGFGVARLPYHYSVESRTVLGNLPWDQDWEAGPARWAGWHRLRNTPRLADGSLDPLAYVPAADMIGPALRQAQGPTAPFSMVISLEISLHVFARTDSEWLLQDAHVSQARDGYVSGSVNLWDERGQLVAQALQRAILRPLGR